MFASRSGASSVSSAPARDAGLQVEAPEEDFGKLDPYFVLSGEIERSFDQVSLFVQGQNLLDSEFETFGLISPNVRGPDEDPQSFFTPGLPFRLYGGLRYQF